MTANPKPTEAVTTPRETAVTRFQAMWEAALPIIAKIVPRGVDPGHVFAVAVTARQRDPRLLECTDISVLRCAILSAQFGLDVSGIGGKAYMIPYFNNDLKAYEARFQFGWRGLVELVMRSGRVNALYTREVYMGEPFEYEDGLQQRLHHVPAATPDQEVVAAWAVAIHLNGYRQPEVLFRHQIDARRRVSKAADGPAWTNWYPEMAKKTVIRLLCKKLPDSPDLARALDIEDRSELGLGPAQEIELDQVAPEQEQPPSRTAKLTQRLSRQERAEQGAEPAPPDDERVPPDDEEREPGEEG